MAFTSFQRWRLRPDGADTNAPGWDGSFGDGVDASDAAAPVVNVTDLVTNGTAVVTSATANFLTGYKRNAMVIDGDGWYRIESVDSSSQVTLDRATGSGTGKHARVGGACKTPRPFCITCHAGAPALTSPYAAGHWLLVKGGTGTLGSPAAVDTYTGWSTDYEFPGGVYGAGYVQILAYGGGLVRVTLDNANSTYGSLFRGIVGMLAKGFHVVNNTNGFVFNLNDTGLALDSFLYDSIIDQNGYGGGGCRGMAPIGCIGLNSNAGGGLFTCYPFYKGIDGEPTGTIFGHVIGNVINGWKCTDGAGVIDHPNGFSIIQNFILNGDAVGIRAAVGTNAICNNTIWNLTGNGIEIYHSTNGTFFNAPIRNNFLGKLGGTFLYAHDLDTGAGSSSPNVCIPYNITPDYNAFYDPTGTKTLRDPWPAGDHDQILSADPFVDSAGNDFRLNTNLNGGAKLWRMGFPLAAPGVTF